MCFRITSWNGKLLQKLLLSICSDPLYMLFWKMVLNVCDHIRKLFDNNVAYVWVLKLPAFYIVAFVLFISYQSNCINNKKNPIFSALISQVWVIVSTSFSAASPCNLLNSSLVQMKVLAKKSWHHLNAGEGDHRTEMYLTKLCSQMVCFGCLRTKIS